MASGFKLSRYEQQPRVQQQVKWFLAHPLLLMKIFSNSRPFLYHVLHETNKRDMPAEIALLPMLESGYDPYAYSRAGATGLWQLMPVTAASKGMVIDWWFDGRRDFYQSTNTALDYIKLLHQQTHNWLLAIAAYDAGIGAVERAVAENKAAQESTAYWNLPLPQETSNYVPKLLALAYIVNHAAQLNLELPSIANKPALKSFTVSSQITLTQIAKFAGISENLAQELNAGMRRWASSPNGSFKVLVPIKSSLQFAMGLKQLTGQREVSWMYHEVQRGETLAEIARNFHTSVDVLKRVNGLNHNVVHTGDGILVPFNLHKRFSLSNNKAMKIKLLPPVAGFKQQPADAVNQQGRITTQDSLRVVLDKLHGGDY